MSKPFSGDANAICELTLERYREYVNPTLAALLKFGGFEFPDWEAEGCIVRDVAGNEFIDCVAGYGVFSLGHRHPAVVQAVKDQLDLINLKTHYFMSIELGELSEMLARISPGDLKYSFVCNSGTEAVEGALKAARIHTGRSRIIGTHNGFHGKTFGSLSVSGRDVYKTAFEPLVPGFSTVPYGDAEAVRRAVDSDTAAVIVEAVQGEGGVNVPPKGYLRELRAITRQAGALLIVDEVRTGLGRTGAMFACEHEGVEPDLLSMAKALGGGVMPIGAFLGTEEIWNSLFGANPFLHSTTFGGNPLACAAAIAAIKQTEALELPVRSARLGRHLLERLEEVRAQHPDRIASISGLGLLAGIHFVDSDFAQLFIAGAARGGLLVAYSLNNPLVVRVEPPLIIEQELLDRAIDIIAQAVNDAEAILGAVGA